MNQQSFTEKRAFSRVKLEAIVNIASHRGKWECDLIDISLSGLFLKVPSELQVAIGERFLVEIHPNDSNYKIRMHATVAHSRLNRVGFKARHMGLKSIKHLTEIVREAVGDTEILKRELSKLYGT